ncbi:branched-chain amino acid aminotransferase II [Sistotremastrum suecicum HHB10207 ss-3]|uniref:Branched-chain-amino-acid aminotransferase n=1 Tax=Sistotremastrum suecicum HHB10207 ss-3 TaxID=1314776 RepID=A0A166AKX3_9AGAM|nr:branched-chain amino acid aminotransferase II [Sistotremastrum suecicum HHB10207 ss-3]
MATITHLNGNGVKPNGHGVHAPPLSKEAQALDSSDLDLPDIDPSKLTITLANDLKPLPPPESLVFGQTMTDHMLIMSFDPTTGWSAPEIKPFGPLSLDPASSCFQYCPNVFEGMKAYLDPEGRPRLFRPDLNMDRFTKSTERVALPTFNASALLELIKKLVSVDARWIPKKRGYSLYIRPTLLGTRPGLGVAASTHALLYVLLSPTGPYFPSGFKPVSLLASEDAVRSWPGGTGGFKLGLNYAPCFQPQRQAAKRGYDQLLWLLGEERRICEVGQMNFFVVTQREDGDLDLLTPPLDGTILPGITRNSCLQLAEAHTTGREPLDTLKEKLHPSERAITMADLLNFSNSGTLLEVFGAATAAVITPVGRIGYNGSDIHIPTYEGGLGPVGRNLYERIVDIQEGRYKHEWSVLCSE